VCDLGFMSVLVVVVLILLVLMVVLQVVGGVPSMGALEGYVPLGFEGEADPNSEVGTLQVALKTDLGVAFFRDTLPLHVLFQVLSLFSLSPLCRWRAMFSLPVMWFGGGCFWWWWGGLGVRVRLCVCGW